MQARGITASHREPEAETRSRVGRGQEGASLLCSMLGTGPKGDLERLADTQATCDISTVPVPVSPGARPIPVAAAAFSYQVTFQLGAPAG